MPIIKLFFRLTLFCAFPLSGQTSLSGFGDITVSETTLDQLPDQDNWELQREEHGWLYYYHSTLQQTVTVHQLDLSKTVRSLTLTSNKVVALDNGITLNQSTLADIMELSGKRAYGAGRAKILFDGVWYFFDSNNPKERLSEIKISGNYKDYKRNFVVDSSHFFGLNSELIELTKSLSAPADLLVAVTEEVFGNKPSYYDTLIRQIDNQHLQLKLKTQYYVHSVNVNIVLTRSASGWQPVYHSICLDQDTSQLIDHVYTEDKSIREKYRDLSVHAVVGFFCSIGGSPPASMEHLFGLINRQEFSKIKEMLYSSSPEIRAHGLIGIIFYRFRHHVDVSDQDRRQMDRIYASPVKIDHCTGCNFGEQTLQETLPYANFHTYYTMLTSSGFLR